MIEGEPLLPDDHRNPRLGVARGQTRRLRWSGESPRRFRKNVSPVADVRFFSESRLRPPDSFMPYRNEGMSEVRPGKRGAAEIHPIQSFEVKGRMTCSEALTMRPRPEIARGPNPRGMRQRGEDSMAPGLLDRGRESSAQHSSGREPTAGSSKSFVHIESASVSGDVEVSVKTHFH
jgi:hypothetical protein